MLAIKINTICPQKASDTLFLGTQNGIWLFNKLTGLYKQDAVFAPLNSLAIEKMLTDNEGRVWILTQHELFVYAGQVLKCGSGTVAGWGFAHGGKGIFLRYYCRHHTQGALAYRLFLLFYTYGAAKALS